jgi:hypothetical protein
MFKLKNSFKKVKSYDYILHVQYDQLLYIDQVSPRGFDSVNSDRPVFILTFADVAWALSYFSTVYC